MRKLFFTLLMASLTTSVQATLTTHFYTGFEYATESEGLLEAVELNGATGQIGSWSGDDFPEAAADGFFSGGFIGGESVGLADNPYGGRMLAIDSPVDSAVHFMDLATPASHDGAVFSFSVGTTRTGSGGMADYDLFGLDQEGNESFRIRIGADAGVHRLGYVADGESNFNLPTAVGSDQSGDLDAAALPLATRRLRRPFASSG